MATIELISVYNEVSSYGILYNLLYERTPEQSISHKKMPTHSEHIAFVNSKPYREWYLIFDEMEGYVGSVYLTEMNEIGVSIFKRHQRKGYGEAAVLKLVKKHKPLSEIPSKRRGTFIANVSPENEASQKLFEKLGAKLIQYTYEIPPCQ